MQIDGPSLGVALIYSALLLTAAALDIKYRRIPNWTVIALAALFIAWIFARPGVILWSALGAFAVTFLVTGLLYTMRWIGAGDSKLLSVVALFAGLHLLPGLAIATTLAGGVIVIGGALLNPKAAARGLTKAGRENSKGVPYGVAIAIGGLLVMFAPGYGLLDQRDEFGLLPSGALSATRSAP